VAAGWHGPHAGGRWFVHANQYHSFPSAHTSAITGFALPLVFVFCHRRRRLMASVAAMPVGAVAISRMALGVHHLSDVLAAVLVGMTATWIVTAAAQRFRMPSWLSTRLNRPVPAWPELLPETIESEDRLDSTPSIPIQHHRNGRILAVLGGSHENERHETSTDRIVSGVASSPRKIAG
jgi:hypothetical protein